MRTLITILLFTSMAFAGRKFNGTTDTISVPGNGTPIDLATEMTLSVWFKTTTISAVEQDILSKWGPTVGNQYELLINFPSTGNVTSAFHEAGIPGTIVNTCSVNLTVPNVWHHMASVWSVSQGFTGIYLDGVLCQFSATHGSVISNGANLIIGAGDTGTRLPFVGTLAEACIYNATLPTGEINSLAKGTPCNKVHATNLVGYWPMTGATALVEPDLSGKLDNGTVTGTIVAPHCPCNSPAGTL